MADNEEKLIDSEESEAKVAKRSSESLERNKSAEKSKSEMKRDEADLARKGEAAERKIKAELEKKEADLARKQEKSKEAEEKKAEKEKELSEKKEPKGPLTKTEKKRVYKKELNKIQSQLPAGSRAFSKVVHNPVVETVSNAAEKTVLRPSVLIGGAVVGIGLGIVIYVAARVYGYIIPNWMLLALLVIGGVLGVLIEMVLKLAGRSKS